MASVVTTERYASGMTFDEYVAYIGSAGEPGARRYGNSERRERKKSHPSRLQRLLPRGVREVAAERQRSSRR